MSDDKAQDVEIEPVLQAFKWEPRYERIGMAGFKAGLDGKPFESNPYNKSTLGVIFGWNRAERDVWMTGWQAGNAKRVGRAAPWLR